MTAEKQISIVLVLLLATLHDGFQAVVIPALPPPPTTTKTEKEEVGMVT